MNTNLTGVWIGECNYDALPEHPDEICRVAFTLNLYQGWFGRLSGFIKDDPAKGAPEPAPIKGKILDAKVNFVMSRPVYYVMAGE